MNTSSRNTATVRRTRMSRLAPALACLFTVLGLPVHAAVSFPDVPMQTNNGVPPNIWFILDDSGSMAWRYMYNPDVTRLLNGATQVSTQTGNNTGSDAAYGPSATTLAAMYDQNYITNTIYYNPSITYRGWQRADGSPMPDIPYTAVLNSNTHSSGGTTANLTTVVSTFYTPTGTNYSDATQYIRHRLHQTGATISGGGGPLIVSSCPWRASLNDFDNPNAAVTTCTRNFATFTWPGGITRTINDEKQNFANWFSYHRTRSKIAKAGASYAFNDPTVFNADSDYRVGFSTIWQRSEFRIPVGTNNGLFTGANRNTWFDRLFDATASSTTPLIPALSRAGAYFSETGATGPWGPQATASQFECRQNFTILTTDGYWNNTSGALTPGNVDNTAGTLINRAPNEDGGPYTYAPARPFRDEWSNTLADIAMHFWKRDLRTDLENRVPSSASNPAFWQHMVTFGISIGLKGTIDPKSQADTDALANGTKVWPNPNDNEDLDRIDDLYHASVNGHGAFVAAGNPTEFSEGIGSALRAISARRGSGSNATVSGTSTAAGGKVFQAKYFAAKWYGELQAYSVSGSGVNTSTPLWTASIPAFATRKILTHNGTAGATFPTAAQTSVLTPDIADYLRGDRSKEQPDTTPSTGRIYRQRTSLLGTIVDSSPTYVKASDGTETVYAGANDGMMHAFDANTGVERFAYVPRGLDFDELKTFSEPNFSHAFFVDGPIITSTQRELLSKTILVGTLGRGGKGLYALDVTDPTAFNATKVLWDKNGAGDNDMGQILSKPLIAKLNDGSTALIVSNGLNSSSENAVLYIFDLETGTEIKRINAGGSNNGLSAPRGWDDDGNGTVDYVYAGDFQGNVWKFDLNTTATSSWVVAGGRPLYAPTAPGTQPVTGGVTIAVDPATDKRWVFFGTGRLLTTSDIVSTTRQTWYGVIDDPAATSSVSRTTMTSREIPTYDTLTKNRAFQAHSTLPASSRGWYIDLDLPPGNTLEGERMVGDQQVIKNVLIAASIIPSTNNPCQPGRGYINAIDAFTGTSLVTSLFDANRNGEFGDAGDELGGNAIGSIDLGVGMVTDPALMDRLLVAGGSLATLGSTPLDPALYGGRISWREIIRR